MKHNHLKILKGNYYINSLKKGVFQAQNMAYIDGSDYFFDKNYLLLDMSNGKKE
jgi:hypothetical protein